MSNLLTHVLRWHGRNPDAIPFYGTGVVVEETVPRGAATPVISALWSPGAGYEVCCFLKSEEEPRRLSDRAKQSIRRKALKRRLDASAPLFADGLYESTVSSNPEYFGK